MSPFVIMEKKKHATSLAVSLPEWLLGSPARCKSFVWPVHVQYYVLILPDLLYKLLSDGKISWLPGERSYVSVIYWSIDIRVCRRVMYLKIV